MKKNINFKIYRPFGPAIMEVDIPEEVVNNLNEYIDKIVADKKKSEELDHGIKLAGDVTQEFLLEKEIAKKSGWANFLLVCASKWIEWSTNQKIKKFDIKGSWVVRQFQNEYNPTHWHGGHISGAGFLKVPSTLGHHVQKEKVKENKYHGGSLQLIHGSKNFLSPSIKNITPEVGKFYFFPHYLMHNVFPFKGTSEERRSISFNAEIDQDIYNVFER